MELVDTILEDAKEPMALMLRELSFDADVYAVFETEENPPKVPGHQDYPRGRRQCGRYDHLYNVKRFCAASDASRVRLAENQRPLRRVRCASTPKDVTSGIQLCQSC